MIKSPFLETSRLATALPYLTLMLWVLPLLLFNSGQQSLMAHDEGYYAQQARWIVESGDWITPQWWGDAVYDRPIGIQWLMALSYTLFGINEGTARLPSLIACILGTLLTYKIGCQLLNQRIAWLGTVILSVTPLWIQYGRLATQDATLVCLELLGIWALLQAETSKKHRLLWGVLAGSMAGLGFLVKGFMVCLPAIALLPYLVLQHRRHHHLFNPGLYLGLVLGAIPPVGWLWVSSWRYGAMPFQELVGKLFLLGTHQWKGTGPLYYLWNIPANAFPWPLFALIGLGLALRHADINRLVRASGHVLLLLGYPVILFVELSLFKTRTQYYPLQLLPFMALLAGVALDWLVSLYANRTSPRRWLSALLTYTFGGLAVLLILAGIAVTVGIPGVELTPEVQHYGAIAFGLGLGWLVLPIVWIGRHWYGKPAFSARHWLAGWLLGPWLALATLGITGVFGNHNPDVKAFLQQPAIASILQTHPIDFVSKNLPDDDAEKTFVLLSFYTPDLGTQVSQVTDLPASRYAWVGPQHPLTPSTHYRRLGSIRGWQLIQASR